ncbi:hypothetical protein [Paucibacter sp. Y2R2-4]|uniref:hypothetical protein n=1 Tax=Paucibacter sp. Y2R2-4 TaxID=2893553 RepID=UPI0021E44463|nr:hypothetical protein [Paucibacter sp. Y2R2-4]MCV2349296.1 hypothetical protein [Paucibacter sp. Y2R2-4]
MANFYAYKKETDSSGAAVYKELQLHQFPTKTGRDEWCDKNSAKAVKASEIPARHLSLFRQFGRSRRADGGFWGVVDSGSNS